MQPGYITWLYEDQYAPKAYQYLFMSKPDLMNSLIFTVRSVKIGKMSKNHGDEASARSTSHTETHTSSPIFFWGGAP